MYSPAEVDDNRKMTRDDGFHGTTSAQDSSPLVLSDSTHIQSCHRIWKLVSINGVCFITAGPITKLCAWGKEESGGHVL